MSTLFNHSIASLRELHEIAGTRRNLLLAVAIVACSLFELSSSATAQLGGIEVEAAAIAVKEEDKKDEDNEEKYVDGATLKTDSDLEESLKRAEAFVAEKNWRNASILWDRVLQKSENNLITEDGETYVSLVQKVEGTIRDLPPSGLQVYRISADGKAKALMPDTPADADAESLQKLVRLYFMSSYGDDAAYELGCRALDERDFVSASRMFSKILNDHPDPSIEREAVLLRSAIAAANLGDHAVAEKTLSDTSAANQLQANVKQHLAYVKSAISRSVIGSDSIAMRLGQPDRSGLMPSLPEVLTGDLTAGYEYQFSFEMFDSPSEQNLGKIIREKSADAKPDSAMTKLSSAWKENKWFPSNQLLFANDRLVVKTTKDIVCLDATTQSDRTIWQSLWFNRFMLDEASLNVKNFNRQYSNYNLAVPVDLPADERNSLFFFDKVHHSMSIHNGLVFTIEGERYSQFDESPPRIARSSNTVNFNQPVNMSRARTNFLTAYDLETGKVVWTRSAVDKSENTEEEDTSVSRVGFLGTPVPVGNLILCPVTEGGSISIYAMDTTSGKSVWKTFLCDDPSSGASLFSPVEITVSGQDAYVTCGTGVLFALNAATGNIQFARRYSRDGLKKKVATRYSSNQQEVLVLKNWDDNIVVAWRNALVVMASDHDDVFAIDRRTGKFLWKAARKPFDEEIAHAYCIGHHNNLLFMATEKSVLCYDMARGGFLTWYQKLSGTSYGRGFITNDSLYIPVEDSIAQYDLTTGKKLAQVGVNLGNEDKVGNIYSDGSKIWVVAMNRVIALRSLKDQLKELDKKIEAGDKEAIKTRASMNANTGKYELALQDLQLLLSSDKDLKSTLNLLQHIKLVSKTPTKSLEFISDIAKSGQNRSEWKSVVASHRQLYFDTAYQAAAIAPEQTSERVLSWLELGISSEFETEIASFLSRYPASLESFKLALNNSSDAQTATMMPVVANIENSNELLQSYLDHESEAVKLSAAEELAILGDKSCLKPALELLSSNDSFCSMKSYLILKNVTKQKFQVDWHTSAEKKQQEIEQWTKWLDENYDSLEIESPVRLKFGRVLIGITSGSSGKLIEYTDGTSLQEVWKSEDYLPEDVNAQISGNRILCEYGSNRIVELDQSGKELVKIDLSYNPRSVRKLKNGNYLVAWINRNQPVVELDKSGKVVWEAKDIKGNAMSAERTPSGTTLITLTNEVVEVDVNSNVTFRIGNANGVTSCKEARRLANGNTLVVFGTTVAEYDQNKNQVLRIRGSISPKSALRLDDGRILVAHATGLRVFDKNGRKLDDVISANVNSVWYY